VGLSASREAGNGKSSFLPEVKPQAKVAEVAVVETSAERLQSVTEYPVLLPFGSDLARVRLNHHNWVEMQFVYSN